MNTVSKLLNKNTTQIWTVSKDDSVTDVHELMVKQNISSLLVTENQKVIGIFTENDFVHRVGPSRENANNLKIENVMTEDPISVSPNQTITECMTLMIDNHIHHLPVVEDGTLVGVVSVGDVVKDVIEELEFHVEQMTNYIQGFQ
jgi:CBS domain-containing protein